MATQNQDNAGIFRGHPQKYPKAMAAASGMAGRLHTMVRLSSRSLIATVVDTNFHTTQGYVLCTTEQGLVHVYGAPMGTLIPQMRIYARIQGGSATNRAYLFDGYAPSLSSLSQSGSILYKGPATSSGVFGQTTASIPTSSSLSSSTGYYWHCFFYLSQLPSSTVILFAMWTGGLTANAVALELNSQGQLLFRSINDNHGYVSSVTVAPHHLHYVQIQPGYTSNEMLIDGQATYTTTTSVPTFAGGGASYQLSVLSDSSGAGTCPMGSWISKIGFGTSYTSGVVQPLSGGVPASDAQIPTFNVSSTQQTTALYLCNDAAGSVTAANTAPVGSASAITLTSSSVAGVSALGPY
jgi:hypothetical protein